MCSDQLYTVLAGKDSTLYFQKSMPGSVILSGDSQDDSPGPSFKCGL